MYNREKMTKAVNLINTMTADMGGTELYYPLNSIFAEPLVSGHPKQVSRYQLYSVFPVFGLYRLKLAFIPTFVFRIVRCLVYTG
jgi:hypothetical protein